MIVDKQIECRLRVVIDGIRFNLVETPTAPGFIRSLNSEPLSHCKSTVLPATRIIVHAAGQRPLGLILELGIKLRHFIPRRNVFYYNFCTRANIHTRRSKPSYIHPIFQWHMSLVMASAIASSAVIAATAVPSLSEHDAKMLDSAKKEEAHLVKERKLILLLDIDMTVLQSTLRGEHYFGPKPLISRHTDTEWMVMLRPHLHFFLEHVSPMYRIILHTKSGFEYASEVRKLIDPQNKWVSELIHASSRSVREKDIKSIADATLCDPRFVAILDDVTWVWPDNQPNLMIIQPFEPFSNLPNGWVHGNAECLKDNALLRFHSMLTALHTAFYLDPATSDTRQLLSLFCGATLSKYIIVIGWTEVTNLHLEYMLLKAASFGAQLTRKPPIAVPDKKMCYVVCEDSAKRSGADQVCIRWVEHCVHNMGDVSPATFYKVV
jgi:hypothetical protein